MYKNVAGMEIIMLEWMTPQLDKSEWIRDIIYDTGNRGSDVAFSSLYLLRNKYDIQLCNCKDSIIRHYNGRYGRFGYTFPIGNADIAKVLKLIEEDAQSRAERLSFCLLTEEQKNLLEMYMPGRFEYTSNDGDSDYVYLKQDLANLSGRAFHKKKNHFSKFKRTYPDYEFSQMGCNNREDALEVAALWYDEHRELDDEQHGALKEEFDIITEAVNYADELKLRGGIIYVNNMPVAMTIASGINKDTCDIHFEKAVGEYAMNGGYAAINKLFAESLEEYKWINREEDLGLEGIRKAKMSYHPKMIIKKYNAVLREA